MCHLYWAISPINAYQGVLAYDMFVAFKEYICGLHIFCSNIANAAVY